MSLREPLATLAALAALIAGAAACSGSRDEAVPGRTAPPAPASADEARGAVVAPAPPPSFHALDAARLDALEAIEIDGWTVTQRDRTATSLVVGLRAADGVRRGLITIGPCLSCREMNAAAWHEVEPALRGLLPGALEDDPASRFELATAEIAGSTCVATWELGAVAWGDELEAGHGARVYCNDGAVELVVRVDDDGVRRAADPDQARARAVRAMVEEPARRLAAVYAAAM